MNYREISDTRNGMRIDWDMPIKMDDGLVLRCDIYRPVADGQYPVIMAGVSDDDPASQIDPLIAVTIANLKPLRLVPKNRWHTLHRSGLNLAQLLQHLN